MSHLPSRTKERFQLLNSRTLKCYLFLVGNSRKYINAHSISLCNFSVFSSRNVIMWHLLKYHMEFHTYTFLMKLCSSTLVIYTEGSESLQLLKPSSYLQYIYTDIYSKYVFQSSNPKHSIIWASVKKINSISANAMITVCKPSDPLSI